MERPTWNTTLNELLEVFRSALRAVAPVLERAQIRHQEHLAYDDWDNIAQCLFANIVERSVASASQVVAGRQLQFPDYATLYTDYSQSALILVSDAAADVPRPMLFHSFVGREDIFDTAVGVEVESDMRTPKPDRREIPIERARFSVYIRTAAGQTTLEQLTVLL
jgi:hypothetical protein